MAFLQLINLQLANNHLSATFPESFANSSSFPSLLSFNLANNQFYGAVPDYINGEECKATREAEQVWQGGSSHCGGIH